MNHLTSFKIRRRHILLKTNLSVSQVALLMKKTVNCSSLFIGTYSIYSILCFLHEVFMKVQVISGATPETFNFLISRCSNVILSVGGETPAFQRILFMLLQTLAVKGYLNMWWIEIFKENVKIWFIELLDMGQWSASQNRLDRAENMSLLIFLRLIKCIYIQIYIKVVVHIDLLWIFLFTGIIC